MAVRTTILLDADSRRAAKVLAAKLDVSPSEVIRRALVSYRDQIVGASRATRKRRERALERLVVLFADHDAAAEIRRLKREDAHF